MSYNLLSWNIQTLTHKKTNKIILSDIKGSISSGQFLTIMGPSGAGKSSLLSLITKRITHRDRYFALDGEMMLNQRKYNLKQFCQFAAYVRQDDILPGTFTVQCIAFVFQATLKLSNKSKQEQDQIISQTIKKLSLYNCKDTYIGEQNVKSISGGQRKRVAIGLQLISDPACIILDQPTSGLDSYNALKLMQILNKLTVQTQKIIIATLHQPSSLIFKQMKSLMLLNKGQVIYNGPAQKIVDYMTGLGIKVNHKMNPADFYMLQISQFTQLNRGCQTRMTAQAFRNYNLELKINKDDRQVKPVKSQQIIYNTSRATWLLQFKTLFIRSFKNAYRSYKNVSQHVGDLVWSILINAIVYWMVAKNMPSIMDLDAFERYWIQVPSALYVVQFSVFGSNLYNTVLLLPSQRQLCYKESGSGLYSLSAFISARILVDLPVSMIKTIILGGSIYFAMGLNDLVVLGVFIGTLTMVGFSSYMMGLFCGSLFNKASQATQVVPILVTPIAIVGGMVVKLTSVPGFIAWLQYLSPIRHGFFAIMIYGLNSSQYDVIAPYKDQLLQYKGIFGTWQQCLYYLGAMTLGLFLLSIALMKYKMRAL